MANFVPLEIVDGSDPLALNYESHAVIPYGITYNKISTALEDTLDVSADTSNYLSNSAAFLTDEVINEGPLSGTSLKDLTEDTLVSLKLYTDNIGGVAQKAEGFKLQIENSIGIERDGSIDEGFNKRAEDFLLTIVDKVIEYRSLPNETQEQIDARQALLNEIENDISTYNSANTAAYPLVEDIKTLVETDSLPYPVKTDTETADTINASNANIKSKDDGLLTFLKGASRDVALTRTPNTGAAIEALGTGPTGNQRADFLAKELSSGVAPLDAVSKRANSLEVGRGETSYIYLSAGAVEGALPQAEIALGLVNDMIEDGEILHLVDQLTGLLV